MAPASRTTSILLIIGAAVVLLAAFAFPEGGVVVRASTPAEAAADGASAVAIPGGDVAGTTTIVPPAPVPTLVATVAPAPTAAPAAPAAAPAAPAPPVAAQRVGTPLDPSWPKTMTVLTDSVVLGAKDAIPEAFPGWEVTVEGRPALQVRDAPEELLPAGRTVGSVVVVALGYNSLWEKNRANFDAWAAKFDEQADRLVAALQERGARKIVWVTLREPSPEVVPAKAQGQFQKYGWYFGYVNERLALLAGRYPALGIADWRAVSNTTGLTYDAIHLNPAGARLMADVIKQAVAA